MSGRREHIGRCALYPPASLGSIQPSCKATLSHLSASAELVAWWQHHLPRQEDAARLVLLHGRRECEELFDNLWGFVTLKAPTNRS